MTVALALMDHADSVAESGFWSALGLAVGYSVGRVHCWIRDHQSGDDNE